MTSVQPISPASIAAALEALRAAQPLVQCLTNIVVAQWTANALLAAGAAPAMVDNPHEAGDFARVAGGVLINTGTPYPDTAAAMLLAVQAASEHGTPWVLDPVAVGALRWRTTLAHQFLDAGTPAIIRGNASEIAGLAGGAGGRGVDSNQSSEAVVDVAKALAKRHSTVVAVSGAVDQITDGDRLVRLSNGHEIMTRVTGVGCSLGALMAGVAAVEPDRLLAATAATALLTVAADRAYAVASQPGSFAVRLLDELAAVTPGELAAAVRLS